MAPNPTKAVTSVPSTIQIQAKCVSNLLKKESERLKTFKNWTVSFLDPKELARDGFYYKNEGDIVRCAFCGVEIACWERGDIPRSDHMKWSPRCDFVLGNPCGNIPLTGDEREAANEESYDTCGPYGHEILPFSGPERSSPRKISSLSDWRDLEKLGISKTSGPVSPQFSTYESRLKSFETWTMREVQSPENLAEAGFYYTKCHDNTCCFHCGGGLKNWEVNDDPWVEHARWFSKCGYINIKKGKDFVKDVLSKNKAMLTAKDVEEISESISSSETKAEPSIQQHNEESEREMANPIESPRAKVQESSTSSSKVNKETDVELCRICYVRERAIVFLPCGHFVSCVECAPSLSSCAVCRKPYEATVRAYLS